MKTFVIILIGSLCMVGYCAIFQMKNPPPEQLNYEIICPDALTLCPGDSTCCVTACGSYACGTYFCCPFPGATCCADTPRCCPRGYTCGAQNLTCNPALMENPTNYH
jgi:hypothetical protein